MSTMNAFGQPVSPTAGKELLGSEVMNANPSPTKPEATPPAALVTGWARVLSALYETRRAEKDKVRLMEIEDMISKAERNYSELATQNDDELIGFPSPPQSLPPQGMPAPGPGAIAGPPMSTPMQMPQGVPMGGPPPQM